MHKYKIFLITGETVEVEAESVMIMSDKCGLRFDFIKNSNPRCMTKPSAVFYGEYIMGWAELPESEEVDADNN